MLKKAALTEERLWVCADTEDFRFIKPAFLAKTITCFHIAVYTS
jgi:hypothetical protein